MTDTNEEPTVEPSVTPVVEPVVDDKNKLDSHSWLLHVRVPNRKNVSGTKTCQP